LSARVSRRFKFLEDGVLSWPELDPVLLILVVLFPLTGVVAVASASMPSVDHDAGPFAASTVRHLAITLVGIAVALVFSQIDYHRLGGRSWIAYFAVIGLLMLVLLPGVAVAGAPRRWLELPGITFQPSELAKPVIAIHLSYWAVILGPKLTQIRWFAAGVAIAGLPILLIVLQPDFGTAALVCITAAAVAITAGIKASHLLAVIPLGTALAAISIVGNPYQLTRLRTFMGFEANPLDSGYQSQQALLALGSGGIGGKGLGLGTVKYSYLPAAHTDSVFAVIGEEFGLIGTGLILLMFLAILVRGLWIASLAPDRFGRCLAAGIAFQISAQAFINMGVVVGLYPVTGIPLPFVSSGGTSLLVSLAMMGILINIARSARLHEAS
jgi:cell division protein FtsW